VLFSQKKKFTRVVNLAGCNYMTIRHGLLLHAQGDPNPPWFAAPPKEVASSVEKG
jgi:hypothetical protein